MSLVAGALCLDGSWPADPVADRIARRCARYAHLSARALHSDARFALRAICRQGDAEVVIACSRSEQGVLSWLVGDANYFCNPPSLCDSDLDEPLTALDRKIPGRWSLVQYDNEGNVRLSSDRLGLLWVYVAPVPGGVVFSSDFGALAEEIGNGLSINEDALLWELGMGYAPGNQTVFNEINLVGPASTVALTASGYTVLRRSTPVYGNRHVGLTRADKFRALDEIYQGVTREILEFAGPSLTLSISGGNDSRYALGLLHQIGVAPKLYTFGHRDSDEVAAAAGVCARIGRTNELFEIPDTGWDAWMRVMRQLGNSGMLQWTGWPEHWLQFLRRQGNNVIIGFMGDALSGGHFRRIARNITDWKRFWLDWSSSEGWFHSSLLRPAARARASTVLEEQVQPDLQGVEFAFPFQRALHLDLYGRQRRWTADQPNLMSRAVLPILPFYRDRVIDFWMNLPLSDLLDQKLYLEYARSRFGVLFPPPPTRVAHLANRALNKAQRIGSRLIGAKPAVQSRPVVIDRSEAIIPNKERVADLARSVKGKVDHLIDVDRFCEQVRGFDGLNQSVAGHIIRATNIFALISLGH